MTCIVVVLPVMFNSIVHEVGVSDRIHGGYKDVLHLCGHRYLRFLDEVIPVFPLSTCLLLINKNNSFNIFHHHLFLFCFVLLGVISLSFSFGKSDMFIILSPTPLPSPFLLVRVISLSSYHQPLSPLLFFW